MKSLMYVALYLFLSACSSVKIEPTPDCAELASCISSQGVAVIGDPESSREILQTALIGAKQFERRFGVAPAPIAIVQGGTISAELNAQLGNAGYAHALPWLSERDKQALQREAVREQVLAQTQGMPKEQQAAVVENALRQLTGSAAQSQDHETDNTSGALTHELGHMWFIAAFKNDSNEKQAKNHGYGGWAPDWLDESAAILMENASLESKRRERFTSTPKEELYPLKEFLTMDHPASLAVKELTDEAASPLKDGESRTFVLTGEEAQAFLAKSRDSDPGKFYTQARGFIDFLLARTNDPHVFSEIANHLASGKDFEHWLSTRSELPNSLNSLGASWNGWLDQR